VLALALVLSSACRAFTDPEPARVEFGVLFGGDVQDRDTIVFEPSPDRQELALRVTFPEPLAHETRVSWELERPTKLKNPDGSSAYAAELGERRARAGERVVHAQLRFRKGDPLGTWRIRVRIDERVALERAFQVVEPPK
jgi:hypothetical protein